MKILVHLAGFEMNIRRKRPTVIAMFTEIVEHLDRVGAAVELPLRAGQTESTKKKSRLRHPEVGFSDITHDMLAASYVGRIVIDLAIVHRAVLRHGMFRWQPKLRTLPLTIAECIMHLIPIPMSLPRSGAAASPSAVLNNRRSGDPSRSNCGRGRPGIWARRGNGSPDRGKTRTYAAGTSVQY